MTGRTSQILNTESGNNQLQAEPCDSKIIQMLDCDSVEVPKDVKYWIKKVREETAKTEGKGAFVYLRPRTLLDPYDLLYCGYAEAERFGRYYTLSMTGFTSYHKNYAEEFLSIQHWVNERSLFYQARKFAVFGLFRAWKVLKIWRHNVIVETRRNIRHQLEKRLLTTRPGFVKVLLVHQAHCKHLEAQKLFDTSDPPAPLTLSQFKALQDEHCASVSAKIVESSRMTQQMFIGQIQKALDEMKRSIKEDRDNEEIKEELVQQEVDGKIAVVAGSLVKKAKAGDEDDTVTLPSNQGDESAFTSLGFQQNLPYTNRSEIQKECKVFLRFGYLLDLLAKTAVTNLYINSVQTLNRYFYQKNSCELPTELPLLRPATDFVVDQGGKPILLINIELTDDSPIPDHDLFTESIDSFEPPPLCHFDSQTFDPTCHLEEVSDSTQFVMKRKIKRKTVNGIVKCWTKMKPEMGEIRQTLKYCMDLMLATIGNYERHTDTPSLELYKKVVRQFENPEMHLGHKGKHDIHLELESVLNDRAEFFDRNKYLDLFIESTRGKIESYLGLMEPYLLKHWKYKHIPWGNIQSEKLRHPVECLTVFAQQIKKFKEEFPLRLPTTADIGYVKLMLSKAREKLCRSPVHALKRMDEIMVIIEKHFLNSRRICR